MADDSGAGSGEALPLEWYSKGLRFTCTQCGNCCTGPPGVVRFNDDEAVVMAGLLNIDVATFLRRYAKKVNGRWSLKEYQSVHGFDCIFLDRETNPGKALCRVYKSRPTQCRTWPFWSENLCVSETWETTKRSTPCPGMDRGELFPISRIRILCNQSS